MAYELICWSLMTWMALPGLPCPPAVTRRVYFNLVLIPHPYFKLNSPFATLHHPLAFTGTDIGFALGAKQPGP